MRAFVMIAGGALALAACSSEPDEPKTAEEVIAAADKLTKPRPGLYRSTAEIVEFDIPGIPPEQAARMREMAAGLRGEEHTQCVTREQADEGFRRVVRDLGEGDRGVSCDFSSFEADGSDLDAALTCTGPGGVNAQMTIDGTVAPESSRMRMEIRQEAAAIPGGEMRMTMEVESERVGDCP
ncbi:DUF3617 domain-containing protein [Pelagerythrobacter marinus]|jgi:hypothetical protein|uniref:DUF3617 family protein n=1 Tax=Pelagerythrobacter marinus TaxID=538382 RepID=A0ABW9UX89_9SPHN|nr:DUF3617 domain-containing protein [Pelagerythrobacter marinus]MEC9068044.1 DUF3617 domain-containing protein [Pseudomonadota bacterium]MXO67312.1 DUF3617 family protein [Pelagerythrobacter marinus]USA38642.1 DUF3617 domain-containing protein [Pelagerythrobacter marinus]WPZ07331.1 DUF3617 domain-containing protein [Pelagerythrobacter marinus]